MTVFVYFFISALNRIVPADHVMFFCFSESVDNEVNESAKRTLVRLSQKLRGVEKGTPLSVRGQVNLLIQQATDPANLYRIFHGWRPQA